jgi:hypothetical protein
MVSVFFSILLVIAGVTDIFLAWMDNLINPIGSFQIDVPEIHGAPARLPVHP